MSRTEHSLNRKILLISYHYPPSMAVGGLRLANFARHLPDHGWQPYVLTIRERYLEQADPQRMVGLGHAPVFRTAIMPTVSDLYRTAKARIARHSKTAAADQEKPHAPAADKKAGGPGLETGRQRLKRYLFSLLLSLPDDERNWILPAVLQGRQILKQERIDCILTSCPPYSVHLIGLALKILTGVRWVADFRDPWITGSRKRLYYTSRLSMAIERRMERRVLRKADAVLVNTPVLTDLLRRTHDDIDIRKIMQLPNGFNPEIFSQFQRLDKFKRFTITYTGSLYFGRSPEPLFKSLRDLIDTGTIRPDQVSVKLVGQCSRIDGLTTESVAAAYGLTDVVEVIPPVSHGQAMEMVARSQLALLLAPDQPFQIPAKAYDYIGTGTRVLALAGEGATAEMIRSTATGEVFRPSDTRGISEFLSKAFSPSPRTDCQASQQALRSLDIRNVVDKLARRLDAICRMAPSEPCNFPIN